MFGKAFGRAKRHRRAALEIYSTAVKQARSPVFYADLGVPDTIDGRFDLIMLHVFLVLHRLKDAGEAGTELAQALFDMLFGDMDRSLREMGVGDLSVGKRVKEMVSAFYGRVAAYDAAVATNDGALIEALERNLYGGEGPEAGATAVIAAYVRGQVDGLAGQQTPALIKGRVRFASPPVGGRDLPTD